MLNTRHSMPPLAPSTNVHTSQPSRANSNGSHADASSYINQNVPVDTYYANLISAGGASYHADGDGPNYNTGTNHHHGSVPSSLYEVGRGGSSVPAAAQQHRQQRKSQIESTVRALVEKNKTIEAESANRIASAEAQIHALRQEVSTLKAHNAEMAHQLSIFANGEGGAEGGKRVAMELLRENEAIMAQKESLEHEMTHLRNHLETAKRDEEDLRATYEDVCNKLAKADRHIRQLYDDAEAKSLTFASMQAEVAEKKELTNNAEKLREELLTHVCKSLFAMAEEAEMLMVESDELSIRTRLSLSATSSSSHIADMSGSGGESASGFSFPFAHQQQTATIEQQRLQAQLNKLKATKAALRAAFHHKTASKKSGTTRDGETDEAEKSAAASPLDVALEVPLRCLPEGIRTFQQLLQLTSDGNEAMIVSIGTGIVDALALVRDDVAVTGRAVDEEGCARRTALTRHFKSMAEAVNSERAHTKQLLAELDTLNIVVKNLEDEKAALTKSLDDMDKFMKEAAHLSESSAQRSAAFVEEKMRAEREAKETRESMSAMSLQMNKQSVIISELTTEVEKWRWTAQQREAEINSANLASKRAVDASTDLQREIENLHAALRSQRTSADEAQSRSERIEVENVTLRKQILEFETQIRILQSKIKSLEAELRFARDETAEAQKRADKALLVPRGSSVIAASAAVARGVTPSFSAVDHTASAGSVLANAAEIEVASRPPLHRHQIQHHQSSLTVLHSPPHTTSAKNTHHVSAASPSVARPLAASFINAAASTNFSVAADGSSLNSNLLMMHNGGLENNRSASLAAARHGGGDGSTGNKYEEWEHKLSGLLQRAQPARRGSTVD